MKHLTKILISIMLITCIAFSTACFTPNDKFSGKFNEEATVQQVAAFTNDVKAEKLFDSEKMGLKFTAKISFGTNTTYTALEGKELEEEDKQSTAVKLDVTANAKVLLGKKDDKTSFKASANINALADEKTVYVDKTEDKENEKTDLAIYLDETLGALVKTTVTEDEETDTKKDKIPIEIFEQLISLIGGSITGGDLEQGDGAITMPNAEELIEMIAEYGIKLYIDDSNGYKVKIVITSEVFDFLFNLIEAPALPTTTVNKGEIYFSVNKDGAFEGIKVDLDLALAQQYERETKVNIEGTAKIAFELVQTEIKDSDIVIPADADEYEEQEIGE